MVRIAISLPRETIVALRKHETAKNLFDPETGLGVRHLKEDQMANQRSADKVCVSAYVPRTTARRLKKLAEKREQSLTELVEALYIEATRDIELTPEDYRQIANEVEAARRGTNPRLGGSRNKSKAASQS